MNQPTLPIVDPKLFMTMDGAAFLLGVSRATVARMIGDGRLTAHSPCGGPRERPLTLLSTVEVNELLTARLRAGVAGRDR